ncbi:MAG: hypothetical protein ACI8RZ_002547 [Myxococcota bacterium]
MPGHIEQLRLQPEAAHVGAVGRALAGIPRQGGGSVGCPDTHLPVIPPRRQLDALVGDGIEPGPLVGVWLPASPEETLIEHLRQHVSTAPRHSPPGREDLLLSLLRGTGLLKTVWSKPELEQLKAAIDQCTDRASIGRIVRKLVEEADAAMLVATA